MSEKIHDSIESKTQTIEEKEKKESIDFLNGWIKISTPEEYKKLVSLLSTYKLPYILGDNTFDSISPNGMPFFIKKVNNWFNIYWKNDNFIARTFRSHSNPFRLAWIINNTGTFISSPWDEVFDENEYNNWETHESRIQLIREETKNELKVLKKQTILQDISYTIQKWDNLWKIVKEKYGLDNNRDIANAINALVSYNNGVRWLKNDNNPEGWDGIKWDKLIAWKTIKIPAKLKIHGGREFERKN